MNHVELAAAAEDRSRFYWWLAGWVMGPPSAEQFDIIRAMDATTELATPALTTALRGMIEAARGVPGAQRETRLGVEYTRLMGGLMQDRAPPPPYEGVWREDQLMGEVTLAVIEAYQDAGYADIDPEAGPQDHLGVELKFISLLALAEHEAWRAEDRPAALARLDEQRVFLERHLLAWVPRWAARVAQETGEPFYRHLAALIVAFLENDRNYLNQASTDFDIAA